MSRPSRQQRLTDAETAARDKLEVQRKAYATIQGQLRALEKKTRDRRRYQVGLLADHYGLAVLDDAVLRPLFTLLSGVASTPNPVALLEALLSQVRGAPGTSVDGYARQDGGVSATP
jgi:hypothetical protein